MPKQTRRHELGETCPDCQVVHLTRDGAPACVGHVVYDRESYQPGQDRQRLDQPKPCSKRPMRGLAVCNMHGGKAKHAQQAGEQRVQRAAAEALALTLGTPIEGSDPGEVIAERIDARRGHTQWLLARVRALEPDALTWGITREKTGGDDRGTTEEAKPHVWYTLYLESARELERLCIDALRVGLEERRVRVDERMADMWVRVIDGVLADLGHDPNDPATAEIVARHLELVA